MSSSPWASNEDGGRSARAVVRASWAEASCYSKSLEFADKSGEAFQRVLTELLDWPGAHIADRKSSMYEEVVTIDIEGLKLVLSRDTWGLTWLVADPEGRALKNLAKAWEAEGWLNVH